MRDAWRDMPAPRGEVQAAVAAIAAAGNDTEALAEAIEKAAFLDDTPGEDRQTLRGEASLHSVNRLTLEPSMPFPCTKLKCYQLGAAARTKLKKIFSDEKKKQAAAEADAIANRSPHKKEVYDRDWARCHRPKL